MDARSMSAPAGPRAKILLIDDDSSVRESLRRMLAREHDVVACGSGDAGLQALEQQSFDLIVCDLVMPGRSGLDVIDEATRRWPALEGRCILMTGAILDADRQHLFEQLNIAMLQKPIAPQKLEQLLRERLG
jgi:CheY-like chemotaxis protein